MLSVVPNNKFNNNNTNSRVEAEWTTRPLNLGIFIVKTLQINEILRRFQMCSMRDTMLFMYGTLLLQ